MMNRGKSTFLAMILSLILPGVAMADSRQMVQMPDMMRDHMLSNMRDHLRTLDEILAALAEARLGMSSLDAHGAEHMAPMLPAGSSSLCATPNWSRRSRGRAKCLALCAR